MALLKLEVRDRYGKPLPQFCDDFLDQKLPVDHSRLAQSLLQLIDAVEKPPAVIGFSVEEAFGLTPGWASRP